MTSTTDTKQDVSDRDTLALLPPSPSQSPVTEPDDDNINEEESSPVVPSGATGESGSDSTEEDDEVVFLGQATTDSRPRTYKASKDSIVKTGAASRYVAVPTGKYYPDGTEIIQIFQIEEGFIMAHSTEPDDSEAADANEDTESSESVDEEEDEGNAPLPDQLQPSPNPSEQSATPRDSESEEESSHDQEDESNSPATKATSEGEFAVQNLDRVVPIQAQEIEAEKSENLVKISETQVSEPSPGILKCDDGLQTQAEVEGKKSILVKMSEDTVQAKIPESLVQDKIPEDAVQGKIPEHSVQDKIPEKVQDTTSEGTAQDNISEGIVQDVLPDEDLEETDEFLQSPDIFSDSDEMEMDIQDSHDEKAGEVDERESTEQEKGDEMVCTDLPIPENEAEKSSQSSDNEPQQEALQKPDELVGPKPDQDQENDSTPIQDDKQSGIARILQDTEVEKTAQKTEETIPHQDEQLFMGSDTNAEHGQQGIVIEEEDDDVMWVADIPVDENRVLADELDIEEDMVPLNDPEKTDFFWNGLDEDDSLLVASRKRPAGMNSMCALCYEWFETGEDTKIHMKDVHLNGTRFHECETCGSKFVAKFLLERHVKLHAFDPKHPACFYSYGKGKRRKPRTDLVDKHYLKRLRRGPLPDEDIERIENKFEEIASQPFQCIDCDAEFKNDKEVLRHFEEFHAARKCIFCLVVCLSFPELKKHCLEVHKYEFMNSFEDGYWKYWAKAREEAEDDGRMDKSDFFHNYSKGRYGDEAERHFQQVTVIREEEKYSYSSSEEETVEPIPETEEAKVSVTGRPRKRKTKAVTKKLNEGELSYLHQNGSKLQCSICSRVFPDGKELENHYRSHAGERPFCCQYCGHGFATQNNRKEHERVHTGVKTTERPYVCTICKKSFVQISNLKKHVAMHSKKSKEQEFKCTTCGKQFLKEASLILHQRAHASERKFKCQECDKAYNYASLLKRHMRIHSGEKPYECDMCGLLFHELVSLHYHRKKIHTGERPHKCDECGRAFILSSDLKKHMSVHSKDKHSAKEEEGKDRLQPDLDLDLIGIDEPIRVTELKSKRSKPQRRNFSLDASQHSDSTGSPEGDSRTQLDDIQEERAADAGSTVISPLAMDAEVDVEMSMDIESTVDPGL